MFESIFFYINLTFFAADLFPGKDTGAIVIEHRHHTYALNIKTGELKAIPAIN